MEPASPNLTSAKMKDPKQFSASMELRQSRILDNKGMVKASNLTASNITILQDCLELAGAKKGEEVRTS